MLRHAIKLIKTAQRQCEKKNPYLTKILLEAIYEVLELVKIKLLILQLSCFITVFHL